MTSVVLAVAACGGGGPPEVRSALEREEAPSDEHLAELVASNTAFAADLYRWAAEQDPGNLFMSPHSISTTLAMTYAGAEGATASQIATALHFDLPPAELHEAMNALDLALAARGESSGGSIPFRLQSANSVWGQVDYPFGAPYLDTLALNYDAGVHVVDFMGDAGASRDAINGWVEDNTGGKIEELLPANAITGMTRLVLTNAVYFTAAWTDPFDSDDTEDGTFQAPGRQVTVPMMSQTSADLGTGSGARFRAAELPYDGDEVSMIIVLPELLEGETGDPLALLEAELTGAKLQEIAASIHPASELHLVLPKFTFKRELSLAQALHSFGMVDAFDKLLADFSPITTYEELYIHAALHQGFILVDEEGTTAAAATAVVIGDDSAPPSFVVDRPFLMLIRDIPTGQILFVGRVVDPTAE
jgi:serpin B